MGPIKEARKKSFGSQLSELGSLIATMAGVTTKEQETEETEEEMEQEEVEEEDEYFEASSCPVNRTILKFRKR